MYINFLEYLIFLYSVKNSIIVASVNAKLIMFNRSEYKQLTSVSETVFGVGYFLSTPLKFTI